MPTIFSKPLYDNGRSEHCFHQHIINAIPEEFDLCRDLVRQKYSMFAELFQQHFPTEDAGIFLPIYVKFKTSAMSLVKMQEVMTGCSDDIESNGRLLNETANELVQQMHNSDLAYSISRVIYLLQFIKPLEGFIDMFDGLELPLKEDTIGKYAKEKFIQHIKQKATVQDVTRQIKTYGYPVKHGLRRLYFESYRTIAAQLYFNDKLLRGFFSSINAALSECDRTSYPVT